MSKRIGKAIAVTGVALLVIVAWRTQAPAVADYDQEIRMLQDRRVGFDLIPPRQYTGWDAYAAKLAGFRRACSDSPRWEISDLHVQGGQGFTFSHSVQHAACSMKNGPRWTSSFESPVATQTSKATG